MESVWVERRQLSMTKRQNDHRSPFQRDRARILHSAAFRRLQSKTQVMGSGQNDFYRTRLTHSLEAAQIGSGITSQLRWKYPEECSQLLPDGDTLIESICLAHDIGHPPFGHGGEVALNFMMRSHGGFEGNGQTLRIVSRLEPFSKSCGMNLTRRSLLGLLKYPQTIDILNSAHKPSVPPSFRQLKASEWHPPKGIFSDDLEILDWILHPLSELDKEHFQHITSQPNKHHKTQYKSFDCSIMELADDIAYGIHDLEDAIVTGVVSRRDFDTHVIDKLMAINDEWLNTYCNDLSHKLFSDEFYLQKEAIGGLVNYLITEIKLVNLNESASLNFAEPLLQYNAKHPAIAAKTLQIFKDFVLEFVIKQTDIQRLEYKGQQIVMELFEAFESDPLRLLPKSTANKWQNAKNNGLNHHRVIADYVAGMTDDYATKLYKTLFIPMSQNNIKENNQ